MQVEPLLDLTCAAVAGLVEGKTVDQLVEQFQISINAALTTNLTAQQDVFTNNDLCHVFAELFVFLVMCDDHGNYLFKLHFVSASINQALEYEPVSSSAAQKRMSELCMEQLSLFTTFSVANGVRATAKFNLFLLACFKNLILLRDYSNKTWPKVYNLIYELCNCRENRHINQDRIIFLLPEIFVLLFEVGRQVCLIHGTVNENKLRAYSVIGVKFIFRCFMYTERYGTYSQPGFNINTIAASTFEQTFGFPLVAVAA